METIMKFFFLIVNLFIHSDLIIISEYNNIIYEPLSFSLYYYIKNLSKADKYSNNAIIILENIIDKKNHICSLLEEFSSGMTILIVSSIKDSGEVIEEELKIG